MSLNSPLLFPATLSDEPTNASLVIYNSQIGLVHEEKTVTLDKGSQAIVYPGVATTVQTDSVNVQLPKDVLLYSQQYRYDKITLNKITEAHIGKKVDFKTGPEEKAVVKSGILLASNPAVVKTAEGIMGSIKQSDLIFASIPEELIMKPSLVWNVDVPESVKGSMKLDYLISNIGWKSDYILNLNRDYADITGWITVNNRSGKRFENIKLNVLAGDINRVPARQSYADAIRMEKSVAAAPVAHQAHEGYHFYSVPFKVTIANNEKTQIKFIDDRRHALKRLYDVQMQNPFTTSDERKQPVSQYVELDPFKMPLPGGIVRTYSKVNNSTVLLGETNIKNTPKNEKVKLRLGTNFDLIAKNKLVERSDDSRYYEAVVAYNLTNRSDGTKTVEVNVPGVVKRTKHLASVTTDQPYTRPDGYTIRFSVTLQPGKTKTWQASYRTKKP